MDATIQDKVRAAALRYGVPVDLALGVARAESGFTQFRSDGSVVRSSEGALGVMQLMPATAAWLGVDPNNTDQNIDGGVRYLSMLYRQFGNWDLVPAAYNTGPGNLQKILAGLKALPAETAAYVVKVVGKPFELIRAGLAPAAPDTSPLGVPFAFVGPGQTGLAVEPGTLLIVAAVAGAVALAWLLLA